MGILVEYNPDLALRDISHFHEWKRKIEECIPEKLEIWKTYNFLQLWQRNYYLCDNEPVPLIKTEWNTILSRPFASIKILEATHFNLNWEIWTKWIYKIIEIYDINDSTIHFEWFLSVKNK